MTPKIDFPPGVRAPNLVVTSGKSFETGNHESKMIRDSNIFLF